MAWHVCGTVYCFFEPPPPPPPALVPDQQYFRAGADYIFADWTCLQFVLKNWKWVLVKLEPWGGVRSGIYDLWTYNKIHIVDQIILAYPACRWILWDPTLTLTMESWVFQKQRSLLNGRVIWTLDHFLYQFSTIVLNWIDLAAQLKKDQTESGGQKKKEDCQNTWGKQAAKVCETAKVNNVYYTDCLHKGRLEHFCSEDVGTSIKSLSKQGASSSNHS